MNLMDFGKARLNNAISDYHDKDNEPQLVKKEEVVEEIALVTIIDDDEEEDNFGIHRQNDEVFFETNNDLQNEGEIRQEKNL